MKVAGYGEGEGDGQHCPALLGTRLHRFDPPGPIIIIPGASKRCFDHEPFMDFVNRYVDRLILLMSVLVVVSCLSISLSNVYLLLGVGSALPSSFFSSSLSLF